MVFFPLNPMVCWWISPWKAHPLSRAAEPTRGDVLACELGRDVALEFCSASRFSKFVQTIVTWHKHLGKFTASEGFHPDFVPIQYWNLIDK